MALLLILAATVATGAAAQTQPAPPTSSVPPLTSSGPPLPPSAPPPIPSSAPPLPPITPAPLPSQVLPPAAPVVAPQTRLPLPAPLRVQPSARLPQLAPRPQTDGGTQLPVPRGDPLNLDLSDDPILNLVRSAGPAEGFRTAIANAIERNPSRAEANAAQDEALAARNEARALQYPTADFSISYFNTISRAFSNDPSNIIERSRPRERTDTTLNISQPLIDFGASRARILAGRARLDAATAGIDQSGAGIALEAIGTWYNVFGFRALVSLGESFTASQTVLRDRIDERIRQGVSAPGDVAQVESYIASAEARLAEYRRALANAEARFVQLTGAPPPPELGRAPVLDMPAMSRDAAELAAGTIPEVRIARAQADAARSDASAVRADTLPNVSAGVDAGRYGVFENDRDYDVRARITYRQRIGGGLQQRVDQANARTRGADARLARIREEAIRDASIAWSDIAALTRARDAIEANYIASRQSRDVLVERFRVARGTLFDVLASEDNYFQVAARYIQTVTELDTARYVLAARTGTLLDILDVEPARMRE